MLPRLYFALRIQLIPFGKAAKNHHLKLYRENGGTDSAAPFRRALQDFSRSQKGATKFFPLAEVSHRILWGPLEGFQPNSKGKIEALKHVKRSYRRAHTSVRANKYPCSSYFSRSFVWYQIEPISISWDAPFKWPVLFVPLAVVNVRFWYQAVFFLLLFIYQHRWNFCFNLYGI